MSLRGVRHGHRHSSALVFAAVGTRGRQRASSAEVKAAGWLKLWEEHFIRIESIATVQFACDSTTCRADVDSESEAVKNWTTSDPGAIQVLRKLVGSGFIALNGKAPSDAFARISHIRNIVFERDPNNTKDVRASVYVSNKTVRTVTEDDKLQAIRAGLPK